MILFELAIKGRASHYATELCIVHLRIDWGFSFISWAAKLKDLIHPAVSRCCSKVCKRENKERKREIAAKCVRRKTKKGRERLQQSV
jgi:hypothetical protein